jgi:hypothetical protein
VCICVPDLQSSDTNQNVSAVVPSIPSWIKNNAQLWSENTIPDKEFAKGIEFLASKGMVKIPQDNSSGTNLHIPGWVKTNAGLWSTGEISDQEFVSVLQYLTDNGIIQTRK